jgi:cell division protein FtsQ
VSDTVSTLRRLGRWLGLGLAVAVLVGLGVLGWHWQSAVGVEQVAVSGTKHAAPDTLRRLAGVDTSATLADVTPHLVADRVARHPWVKGADVSRLPTGTVRIAVTERTPAALALDASGAPAFYVDADGYMMPLAAETAAPDATYDVPLLRGLAGAYHPLRPIGHAGVRELLAAMTTTRADTMLSGFTAHADSTITAHTLPAQGYAPMAVQVGRDGFAPKLRRLQAFWTQVVQQQPGRNIAEVDLRFDGQVVTRPTRPDS